jgi:AraC family transcriptional regulator
MKQLTPIRFARGRPMFLGGLRRYHLYAQSEQSIPGQWQQFRFLGQIPGQLGSICYGVMCGHDAGGIEYMCGVEVESFVGLPADLGRMRIMEQDYAVFEHSGHISEIRSTWESILHAWLPTGGYRSAHKPDFERYNEQFDQQTGYGRVEIWISIMKENRPEA